ncbi:MAG: TonB-dependent receptor [Candidatus Marinimicrobia bacterium]|nr:TonB-dependent receptor [Candidatus Neomarinimicrobiota bacterium]
MKNQLLKLLFTSLLVLNQLIAANGKIVGRVVDQKSGEPIVGASVMLVGRWSNGKEVELSSKTGAACDNDGYYFILNVVPGLYSIKASMMGHKAVIKTQVRVNMDRTITVDFELEETVLEMDAVQVIAQREIIKADVSGTQEIINTDRLAESPVIRMDEFVNNIKGVELVADEDGNGISIRGGSVQETDVRIDGISARDPRSGNSYLSFNSTSVSEMQVMTGGFEAKYGGFRSGMVNVVTKEGSRDKYTVSLKLDYANGGQKKYFGTDPWSKNSWIYRVYADTTFRYYDPAKDEYFSYAMNGVPKVDSLLAEGFPDELRAFKGWNDKRTGLANHEILGFEKTQKFTPEQKRQLWMLQHPNYDYYDKPDVYAEGTITGPLPLLKKSTFLAGGKFERTQFAFPIGPRDYYQDYNGQIKITSRVADNMKLSINALYGNVQTNTANRPSNMGGALVDYSSRFSFLNNNQSSVRQQARILGSGSGFVNMFNKSQLQQLTQQWIMSGIKLNHTLSPRIYHTLDVKFTYNDNKIDPMTADTTLASAYAMVDSFAILNYPKIGTPNGSTNMGKSIDDMFLIYGGLQQVDSSYSWSASVRWDLTAQVNRFNQVETGFDLRYYFSHVYSGTWLQSEKMFTLDTWQYYDAKPFEFAAYIQDKLEFQGMIANIGLRLDYFNANRPAYRVSHPLDEDFSNFYNLYYDYLPGQFGSWERWKEIREELSDPDGWPEKDKQGQLKLSPRLGVSFPITTKSKMYFNFGHSYQRPNMAFVYNMVISGSQAAIPSPDLEMGKTVLYEFGYEQQFLKSWLINTTLYYKDVSNDPLSRQYVDYWQEFSVMKYYADAYSDIRGVELRLEKNYGRFLTFWANYEYILKSWGRSGLAIVYENKVLNADVERSANITTTEPQPEAHFNVNFHTPPYWKLLGGFTTNFQAEWRDGGKVVMKYDQITGKQLKVDVVDYFSLDMRTSKAFKLGKVNAELVLTIQNLLNIKRLYISGMSTSQYSRYQESLRFWYEEDEVVTDPNTGEVLQVVKNHGNDKWGEWDKEHIDTGWFTAPLFLNPRRILLGIRFNF